MPPKARKGPDAHASETAVGTVAKGNDGNTWVVSQTAKGVRRWVPRAATAKTAVKAVPKLGSKEYLTHYNGDRPFMVRYNKSAFTVFEADKACRDAAYDEPAPGGRGFLSTLFGLGKARGDGDLDARLKKCFVVPVMTCKHKRVFVGKSTADRGLDGNSMLFEVDGGRYVHVGADVISFKPPERIEAYESPVYGSDVAYPYAVGPTTMFLVADNVTVPRSALRTGQPPHEYAYFRHVEDPKARDRAAQAYARAHRLPGRKRLR